MNNTETTKEEKCLHITNNAKYEGKICIKCGVNVYSPQEHTEGWEKRFEGLYICGEFGDMPEKEDRVPLKAIKDFIRKEKELSRLSAREEVIQEISTLKRWVAYIRGPMIARDEYVVRDEELQELFNKLKQQGLLPKQD